MPVKPSQQSAFDYASGLERATYRLPSALVLRKLLPRPRRRRVVGQADVALELEHTLRGIGARSLAVVVVIPRAVRRVLALAGLRGVDKLLLADGVRADERDQVGSGKSLGLEQRDVGLRVGKGARDEPRGRQRVVVDAPDVGLDARPPGARRRRGDGVHLDQVGHGDVVLLVTVEPGLRLGRDVLQPPVLDPGQLVGVEDHAAVGAAGGQGGLPGRRVVEAEADGAPGVRGAPAAVREAAADVGDDVAPLAAGVCRALGRVDVAGRGVVAAVCEGVQDACEDGGDLGANCGEGACCLIQEVS